jgi:acetylornithine deacetylase/succinyl-diaminopimelate desuccinylase-like protein
MAAPTTPPVRQRRAARQALYGTLVASALLAGAAVRFWGVVVDTGPSTAWYGTDWEAKREVRLLQEYLRIDTTTNNGNEYEAAQWLERQFEGTGARTIIDRIDERHANFIAVIEGDDPRALILHHHIDTEPIDPREVWAWPPFAAEIRGPWLYGRGVYDMKSVGIAQLEAVLRLLESGRRPARRVIYVATSSEEVGSDLGTDRVLRFFPWVFEDAYAMLTEGGFVEPTNLEEIKFWAIEIGQKQYLWATLCHEDPDLLQQISEDVEAQARPIDRLRVEPAVSEFLSVYAATRSDPELAARLADPAATISDLAEFGRLPEVLQRLFRTQAAVLGPVEAAAGGGYQLEVSIHVLPGDDPTAALERFLSPSRLGPVAMAVTVDPPSRVSSTEHPVYRVLVEALDRTYPGVPQGPVFLPATATDSRFVRPRGIQSYGFSPFLIFAADTFTMSAANERVGLPGYVAGVEIYHEVVSRIAAGIQP